MPKLGVCAGLGADDSDRLCQQLLEVKVSRLPDNAAQLQNLLESGKVVVTQVGSCWDCALLQDLLNALSLPSGCLGKGSAIVCSSSRYHTVALQATFQSVRQVHQDLLTPGLGVLAEHLGTHIAFGFLGPGTPRCHL